LDEEVFGSLQWSAFNWYQPKWATKWVMKFVNSLTPRSAAPTIYKFRRYQRLVRTTSQRPSGQRFVRKRLDGMHRELKVMSKMAKIYAELMNKLGHNWQYFNRQACFLTQYGVEKDIFGRADSFDWNQVGSEGIQVWVFLVRVVVVVVVVVSYWNSLTGTITNIIISW
jgi:hypothetical protein